MVLGRLFRTLLIVLDISLIVYTVTQLMYRVLPVTDPFFWVGAVVEVGLAVAVYIFWMRSRATRQWNSTRTLAIFLLVLAIGWPIVLRYTGYEPVKTAASADILFYCTALSLLIYSSFVIQKNKSAKKS